MEFQIFLQHFVNGIAIGSLYALIAIGYTMVYGILRLINFAHGDIFMMASYFMVFTMLNFKLPWFIAIPISLILTIILGLVMERCAYRPLREAPRMSIMISAIGVSFLLENLATYLFTGVPKGFPALPALTKSIQLGGVSFQVVVFVIPAITLVLLIGLLYLVNKTKIGMAMRAVAKDYDTASLMGIQINKVIGVTFIIGSLLAGVGAILWGARYPSVVPLMGVMPGLKCFVAAVLGGIGNIPGAVLGGFILGMGETFLVAFMPSMTGFRDAFAFVLLIVILFAKPTGILGEKIADKV